nr:MAG TPA: hypothetical protein [Bacteriophage sp.]
MVQRRTPGGYQNRLPIFFKRRISYDNITYIPYNFTNQTIFSANHWLFQTDRYHRYF